MHWGAKKKLYVFQWDGFDPVQSFAPLAAQPYSIFLDSSKHAHDLSRVSYICWHPFETIESKGGRITITNAEHQFTYAADPFQVVRERLALWGEDVKPQKDLPSFQGGAVGFFGYDLARGIEKLPKHAAKNNQPDMCIGLYDKVLAFDHQSGKAQLMIRAASEEQALAHKAYLERLVDGAVPEFTGADLHWTTGKDDAAYKKDIARVIEYIYAGDIFQTNLSRRFTAQVPHDFDAFAHYAHLRAINGAPYGAFLNFGGVTLASSSPERFLEVRGRTIETRPIKGTHVSAAALENSEKDRAENIMIVDLLRNDLSKVCEDHSVEVTALCKTEAFEGLHHLVSSVRGKLRGDQSALDALRACFPGGSITGAPKIRAMEIIEELEPHRRGAYCGAIGYVGFDGAMDTSITIRTLVYEGCSVQLQTGGGITAQSEPQAELDETLTKAQKIFESFAGKGALQKTA
jgi:para-aminobenzoate synthetase component I